MFLGKWPKKCPSTYSQHLWVINSGCEINYCVEMNALSPRALPVIRRPPYQQRPRIATNESDLLISAYGEMIVRNRVSGKWINTGKTGKCKFLGCFVNNNTSRGIVFIFFFSFSADQAADIVRQLASSPSSGDSTTSSSSATASDTTTITILAVVSTLAIGCIIIFATYKIAKRFRHGQPYEYTNASSSIQSTGHNPAYSTFTDGPPGNSRI